VALRSPRLARAGQRPRRFGDIKDATPWQHTKLVPGAGPRRAGNYRSLRFGIHRIAQTLAPGPLAHLLTCDERSYLVRTLRTHRER
jgi:hypothetical protein